jgi:hypothetical protein
MILKVAAFLLLLNWLVAQPSFDRISIYNHLVPGRLRFPFTNRVTDNYNVLINDLDALFLSHVVSADSRPAGEYRVFLFGDSSIWGGFLPADQSLAEQLNRLELECSGRRLHFYNLGYPQPSALQDLLFLERALRYQPDMILWSVTLNTFVQRNSNPILLANPGESLDLLQRLDLDYKIAGLKVAAQDRGPRTILEQRRELARLSRLQMLGLTWAATGLDRVGDSYGFVPLPQDLDADDVYLGIRPPVNLEDEMMFDTIEAFRRLAGNIPVLIVNEPIMINDGANSGIRYNSNYPRWAYDGYLSIMERMSTSLGWEYADLWDVFPYSSFTDSPFHLSASAEQTLAGMLAPQVRGVLCPAGGN